ncbi:MAG: 30S ribosomal protein S8 [Patescibacteria group bacterium]
MVSDPIGDMLVQIKNAAFVGRRIVELPSSRLKKALAQILVQEGYIEAVEEVAGRPQAKLRLILKYSGKTPVLTGVKRVSKPGWRFYVGSRAIPEVLGGMGVAILSTPEGLMTGKEAKKRHLGGELLCEVW